MSQTKENFYIGNTQLWTLLASTIWPTIIGYGGGIMAREVSRDMWLGGILAILTTFVLIFVLVYTGKKFPGQTIVEYSHGLVGKIPAKVLGLVLVAHFLLGALQSIAIYVHHINDFLLTETPFIVITVVYVIVVCYLVWHGPEVIARIGVIAFIMASVFSVFVFVASLQEINLYRVLPLFDNGFPAVVKASLTADSFIGYNVMALSMLLPLAANQKKVGRSAALGLFIGGIIFVCYLVVELMVMGPHVTAQMRVACMDLVRSIQITTYLHRFESFMLALWYWSMLVQAGILAYCAALAAQQTLGMSGIKKLSNAAPIALGILLISLTYLTARNRVVFLNFIEHGWKEISLPVAYGLPLLLALISLVRKPQTNQQQQKKGRR